ncbi:MAG: M48 family metallopeptidase [Chromatiales bacterium]|nr:M48 family metallopeptidase [Chromatiales bacterium]
MAEPLPGREVHPGVTVSQPLRSCLCGALLCVAGGADPALADDERIRLPDMGDSSSTVYTAADDAKLAREFMRQIRRRAKVIEDPVIADYVARLGARLAAHAEDPLRGFTFFVLLDPTINAFAGPGAYIGVHTGLITTAQTEGELAAVLAHEIAHVTQNHLSRRFELASQMALPTAAALIAAIALGMSAGASGGIAAAAAVQAGALQQQINFTRANEQEADRIGLALLAGTGFDPRSMPAFLEQMQRATQIEQTKLPEYLLTHPITSNRVADTRARAETYPYKQTESELEFFIVRERIALADETRTDLAVSQRRAALESGRHRNADAARYGLALALSRAGRHDEAEAEAASLARRLPDEPTIAALRGEVAFARGNFAQARNLLAGAIATHPGNPVLAVPYARALLAVNEPAEARRVLSRLIEDGYGGVEVYRLAADAASRANDLADGYLFQAEFHYLSGNTEAAVRQLELAQGLKNVDFYQRARIDARLKEVREVLAEEKKDKRTG